MKFEWLQLSLQAKLEGRNWTCRTRGGLGYPVPTRQHSLLGGP